MRNSLSTLDSRKTHRRLNPIRVAPCSIGARASVNFLALPKKPPATRSDLTLLYVSKRIDHCHDITFYSRRRSLRLSFTLLYFLQVTTATCAIGREGIVPGARDLCSLAVDRCGEVQLPISDNNDLFTTRTVAGVRFGDAHQPPADVEMLNVSRGIYDDDVARNSSQLSG